MSSSPPRSGEDEVRVRLSAIGRRLARAGQLRRAVDAVIGLACATSALLAVGHVFPAAANAVVPGAALAALVGASWVVHTTRRGPTYPLLAAWRCDRALGLPEQVLAALETIVAEPDPREPASTAETRFSGAVARVAARALASAPDERLAPITAGPRASLALAAVLTCACALVAGGLPAGGVADPGPAAMAAELDAVAATLTRAPTAAATEAARRLAHAARALETGTVGPARTELAHLGAERDRARAAADAARSLAQDPALARIQRAVAAGDQRETAHAIAAFEAQLAGAGAGDGARESASRALSDAANAVSDATLERPLQVLAAQAAQGVTDAGALTQALQELALTARSEADLALAHAAVERALGASGAGTAIPRRAAPGENAPTPVRGTDTASETAVSGSENSGLARLTTSSPGPFESLFVPPPTNGNPAPGQGRAARPVRLADRPLVDAYLRARSRR